MKLAIFDVDGTLVDSQAHILAAMQAAFAVIDRPMPDRAEALAVVGLSLEQALGQLAQGVDAAQISDMCAAYRSHYFMARQVGPPPLYPQMGTLCRELAQKENLLLGIATGKSRRGLHAMLVGHGLQQCFQTLQCADDHPSKPHPSMLLEALAKTGCDPCDAVMIGDTSVDMEMAHAAGVAFIGVDWGYHSTATLAAAHCVVSEAKTLQSEILAYLFPQEET